MKLIIANSNPIHEQLEKELCQKFEQTIIINDKQELNLQLIEEFNPQFIFFPHWSYFIPASIYEKYNCVVFHMTDLPYGRGGSPLQNLIVRGHQTTFVSALKVTKGLDTGPIYLKKELSLLGTAEEIFLRTGKVIHSMIDEIVSNELIPKEQKGEVVNFKRRTPAQSDISKLKSLEEVFDYIRMLDAQNYPPAFIETENLRFEFTRASLKKQNVIADVRIIKK